MDLLVLSGNLNKTVPTLKISYYSRARDKIFLLNNLLQKVKNKLTDVPDMIIGPGVEEGCEQQRSVLV